MNQLSPQTSQAIQDAADRGEWQFNLKNYLRRTLGDAAAKSLLQFDSTIRDASNL